MKVTTGIPSSARQYFFQENYFGGHSGAHLSTGARKNLLHHIGTFGGTNFLSNRRDHHNHHHDHPYPYPYGYGFYDRVYYFTPIVPVMPDDTPFTGTLGPILYD
jgi:hypothetical protein